MSKLFVEARSFQEQKESELHPFTKVLKRELTGQSISEAFREQRGYGVTWWEVVWGDERR